MNGNGLGIFDSGIGGLAVVRELKNFLPKEKVLYVADSKNFPYGTKTKEEVKKLARRIIDFFIEQKRVKAIVVACNTASSAILPEIQKELPVPILGMVSAGVKSAQLATRNKKVAVLSTPATAKSHSYLKNMSLLDPTVEMLEIYSQELVNVIEEEKIDSKDIYEFAQEKLKPVLTFGADTLILGCTHFPFLNKLMEKILGDEIKVVDPSKELAYEVSLILDKCKMASENLEEDEFYTTGDNAEFLEKAHFFLGDYVNKVLKLDI